MLIIDKFYFVYDFVRENADTLLRLFLFKVEGFLAVYYALINYFEEFSAIDVLVVPSDLRLNVFSLPFSPINSSYV